MHFIGRTTWLERFKDYVQQDKGIYWRISGPPGIGKSILLRRFEQHCDEEKHPNVWLDMENPEFAHGLDILTELARSARYFDAEKSGKTLLEKTGESAVWLKDKLGGAMEAGKQLDPTGSLITGGSKLVFDLATGLLERCTNE